MIKFFLGLILGLIIGSSHPSHAHDWTGAHDPVLQEWFMQLRRQDNMSCCGLGDAYKVRILQEADMNHPYEDVGIAEIVDGSEMNVQIMAPNEGSGGPPEHRKYLPNGTTFRFAYHEVTREKAGNPTPFAWAFLSVWENSDHKENNSISTVYCVVPLPPSF